MYFELANGHIVTEYDIKLAYEICFGKKANNNVVFFKRWVNTIPVERIPESEITVERLVNGDAFVQAVKLYREQHNCTLSEAYDACDKIRKEMEV